jgi:arsenate reductase
MNILFLCTGNSCRSILAEATFNHLASAGWRAMSAGSQPTGQVHPRALALLAREGIATSGYHSKSWEHLPATPDLVITVCGSAAGETCPAYLGPVLRCHWGVDDPAHVTGSDAQIDAAFDQPELDWFELAFALLERRARVADLADFKLRMKWLKYLLGRGFTQDQARYAISALQEQEE